MPGMMAGTWVWLAEVAAGMVALAALGFALWLNDRFITWWAIRSANRSLDRERTRRLVARAGARGTADETARDESAWNDFIDGHR